MPNTPSMVKEGMMGMRAGVRCTRMRIWLWLRDLCSGFSDNGSHSGASDGCGYCRQRKLSGLVFYVFIQAHGTEGSAPAGSTETQQDPWYQPTWN